MVTIKDHPDGHRNPGFASPRQCVSWLKERSKVRSDGRPFRASASATSMPLLCRLILTTSLGDHDTDKPRSDSTAWFKSGRNSTGVGARSAPPPALIFVIERPNGDEQSTMDPLSNADGISFVGGGTRPCRAHSWLLTLREPCGLLGILSTCLRNHLDITLGFLWKTVLFRPPSSQSPQVSLS